MKKKTLRALAATSIALSTLLFASAAWAQSGNTKVYMLFVWGTQTTDTRPMVELSRHKIEAAFKESSDSYANNSNNYCAAGKLAYFRDNYVARYETLDGSNASPRNIYDKCRELSSSAGPNDAVFVYILCHGGVVKGTDGKKRHGLSPIADTVNDLDMFHKGIARDTIMQAICSNPHRLDVLITDSCTTPCQWVKESSDNVRPVGMGGPTDELPYLAQFLLNASGKLNVNSSRPETNYRVFEEALGAYDPNLGSNSLPNDNSDRFIYERYLGTVFTNAFLDLAVYGPDSGAKSDPSVERFFQDLRAKLSEQFSETLQYTRDVGNLGLNTRLKKQGRQTLTRFTDDSLPLQEDLDY